MFVLCRPYGAAILRSRYWTVWYRRAMLRMEDKIRGLCLELLSKTGDEEVGPILTELREALHQHIKLLRERVSAYPYFVERRGRHGISPLNKQNRETATKETRTTETRTKETSATETGI